MPIRPTSLTGAVGEHYVAYQLCMRGYSVGIIRGGNPRVDLVVTNQNGNKTISIQVKTKVERKGKKSESSWWWFVHKIGWELNDKRILYAFVESKEDYNELPAVFIVPSKDVVKFLGPNRKLWTIPSFEIKYVDKDKYLERWDIIEKLLKD